VPAFGDAAFAAESETNRTVCSLICHSNSSIVITTYLLPLMETAEVIIQIMLSTFMLTTG